MESWWRWWWWAVSSAADCNCKSRIPKTSWKYDLTHWLPSTSVNPFNICNLIQCQSTSFQHIVELQVCLFPRRVCCLRQSSKKKKREITRAKLEGRKDQRIKNFMKAAPPLFSFSLSKVFPPLCSCHYMPLSHEGSVIKCRRELCGEERRKTATYSSTDATVCLHPFPSIPPSLFSTGNPIITCGWCRRNTVMKWRLRVNMRRKIKGLSVLFFAPFHSVLESNVFPGRARSQQPASCYPGKQQSQDNI